MDADQLRIAFRGHQLAELVDKVLNMHVGQLEAFIELATAFDKMQQRVAKVCLDKSQQASSAEAHIREDHDILRALWNRHQPGPCHPEGCQSPEEVCQGCSVDWPCKDREILEGILCQAKEMEGKENG